MKFFNKGQSATAVTVHENPIFPELLPPSALLQNVIAEQERARSALDELSDKSAREMVSWLKQHLPEEIARIMGNGDTFYQFGQVTERYCRIVQSGIKDYCENAGYLVSDVYPAERGKDLFAFKISW